MEEDYWNIGEREEHRLTHHQVRGTASDMLPQPSGDLGPALLKFSAGHILVHDPQFV